MTAPTFAAALDRVRTAYARGLRGFSQRTGTAHEVAAENLGFRDRMAFRAPRQPSAATDRGRPSNRLPCKARLAAFAAVRRGMEGR